MWLLPCYSGMHEEKRDKEVISPEGVSIVRHLYAFRLAFHRVNHSVWQLTERCMPSQGTLSFKTGDLLIVVYVSVIHHVKGVQPV